MVLNPTNAFEIYKKIEKSGDSVKSPYEVINVILNQLHMQSLLKKLQLQS